MELTANQLAALVGGVVEGDGQRRLSTLAKIEEAGPEAVAFLANPKYEGYLYESQAGAVLVREDLTLQRPCQPTLIRVADPYSAFTKLLEEAQKLLRQEKRGVEQPSYVHPGVQVPQDAYIGAFAYVGAGVQLGAGVQIYPQAYIGEGCRIGAESTIYAGAKLYQGTVLGAGCIIHSGAVLGADGFGHAPQPDGSYRKIPQTGIVVLGDQVEIGANTTIDRATMGQTVIGAGAKLDNLIQIAHNVEIGAHTVIAAQAGVAGSSTVGAYSQLGGQSGVPGHIKVAAKTRLAAQSAPLSSVEAEGQTLLGSPALPAKQYFRSYIVFQKLPELLARVEALEKGK